MLRECKRQTKYHENEISECHLTLPLKKNNCKLQSPAFSRRKALSLSPYVYINEYLKQANLVKIKAL